MPPWTQIELLTELEPVVGRIGSPPQRGRGGSPTSMCRGAMAAISTACWAAIRGIHRNLGGEVARTALVVNLLTEDNLPSYHRDIYESFGTDGAWGTWISRWTAEEGRHEPRSAITC